MSEEVSKEQTKGAKQEEKAELTDEQLDEAAGGFGPSTGGFMDEDPPMGAPPNRDDEGDLVTPGKKGTR